MEASSETRVHHYPKEIDKEVDDELNGNSSRFPKDGFPQLGEQGDNICQIK